MFVQFELIVFILVIYQNCVNCSVGDENLPRQNLIDSHRATANINFLKKDIQIPDGVSDAFVCEIRSTLNYYENPLLRIGHELINCNGSSNQYEQCLNSYNQFEETATSLHRALTNLEQRFTPSAELNLKHFKKLFNFGTPTLIDKVYNITKDYVLRIKFNFSVDKGTSTTKPSTTTTEPSTTSIKPNTTSTEPSITSTAPSTMSTSSTEKSPPSKPPTHSNKPPNKSDNDGDSGSNDDDDDSRGSDSDSGSS